MSLPIQTYLEITFANGNVTEYVMPDLLSFSFTDNETQEADTVNLTLMDPKGKWADRFRPHNGEVVTAKIFTGTVAKRSRKSLSCGTFFVDDFDVSGPPRVCKIGAVSVPLDKPIRRKVKTRAWENKDLKGIASQIAKEAGLSFFFNCEDNPSYDREDQKRESDLAFLMRLCDSAGFSVKVTSKELVIYDQSSYEKKKPIKTLTLGVSNITGWRLGAAISETYKSVTVKYRDPKVKSTASNVDESIRAEKKPALIEYTYTDPTVDSNGQEYELKTRAKNLDEAKRLARAKLRALNRRAVTGELTLVGDVDLRAGVVVALSGFGSVDGNFVIESAEHSIGTGGYTVSVNVRRVNKNY